MNVHEARTRILTQVAGTLYDLATDPDEPEPSAAEITDLEDAMLEAAAIIAEDLALEVLEVEDGGTALVRLRLPTT